MEPEGRYSDRVWRVPAHRGAAALLDPPAPLGHRFDPEYGRHPDRDGCGQYYAQPGNGQHESRASASLKRGINGTRTCGQNSAVGETFDYNLVAHGLPAGQTNEHDWNAS